MKKQGTQGQWGNKSFTGPKDSCPKAWSSIPATDLCKFYFSVSFYQVVFRGGEGALQVLPPLVDVIPEARLNLVSACSNSLQKYILTSNQLKCWKIPS